MLTPDSVIVPTLGERQIPSPLTRVEAMRFVDDAARVRYRVELLPGHDEGEGITFEKAGPRERLFFEPGRTRAAIATCGGLCPGLNNVIRSVTLELIHHYGVSDILGIRYGYAGLNPAHGEPPLRLTREVVKTIHSDSGTILGTSRGAEDPALMVDTLAREQVNLLFLVGGDGTLRGAHQIHAEAERRGMPLSVIGVPKTIDNDILYVYRSFGYSTSLERAREVIACAHTEAEGAPNGIGLVKLMGRDAGFIAAGATIASQEVNATLIPEIPFALDGDKGLLTYLERRMRERGHAVVVVAEGAGQDLFAGEDLGRDASGNARYGDIGAFLRERIPAGLAERGIAVNLKYFDPSYTIRSVPANSEDRLFCDQLARYAVHAAMAGKTDTVIGLWHNVFIHVPISLTLSGKKRVSPASGLWSAVLESTGQPARFT